VDWDGLRETPMMRIRCGVGKIRLGALFRNEERDASGWICGVFLVFVFSDLIGLYLDVTDGESLGALPSLGTLVSSSVLVPDK